MAAFVKCEISKMALSWFHLFISYILQFGIVQHLNYGCGLQYFYTSIACVICCIELKLYFSSTSPGTTIAIQTYYWTTTMQPLFLSAPVLITDICPFWYTTALFRPVKIMPKSAWIRDKIAQIAPKRPKLAKTRQSKQCGFCIYLLDKSFD